MVASFMDKAVTKSYVQLPGSGSDRKAGASFCDLSRGSNLAAIIPVPQHVGMPIYPTARQASSIVTSTTHSLVSKLAASIPVSKNAGMPRQASSKDTSATHKRPRNEECTNESNKRIHIDSNNQNVARTSINIIKPVSITTAPVTISRQEINSSITPIINKENNEPVKANQNPIKIITINTSNHDMTKLQQENSQLRSGNESLQMQLSKYKRLFNNLQILESFVQHLKNGRALIKPVPAITKANNEPVKANQNPSKVITINTSKHDMTKLQEEYSQLRSENESLQRQFSMFTDLFSNPQKLESVLQRLKNERALIKPVPAA